MQHSTKNTENMPTKKRQTYKIVKIYLKPQEFLLLQEQAKNAQFSSVGIYLKTIAKSVKYLTYLSTFLKFLKVYKEFEHQMLEMSEEEIKWL